MKRQYRISPGGRTAEPTDKEIAGYRDPKRLLYNYEKAVRRSHKPVYKDPKSFLVLLLIVLMAVLLAEVSERKTTAPPPVNEQHP